MKNKIILFILFLMFAFISKTQTQKTNDKPNAYKKIIDNKNKDDKPAKRYYTGHVMSAFIQHINDLDGWLNKLKASGYNTIWLHHDNFPFSAKTPSYYVTNLRKMFDAADRVGGIEIMPGGGSALSYVNCITDSWNRKSLMRIKGKRVFAGWNWQGKFRFYVDSALKSKGIIKDDYLLFAHSYLPYTWSFWPGKFIGEITDSITGIKTWNIVNGAWKTFGGRKQFQHLFETRPELDGYLGFTVDINEGFRNLLSTDSLLILETNSLGKYAFPGINAFYASAQYTDYGFGGLTQTWEKILAFPIKERPIGVTETTSNDYVELSYMSPMPDSVIKGLCYIPKPSKNYTLGNNIRYPLTDHSGMNAFCKPYIQAFLNDLKAPVIKEEKIFGWYMLHPISAPPMHTMPAELKGVNKAVDSAWFSKSIYCKNSGQINAIIKYLPHSDNIKMAAHLTKPGYLKINDSISELKPAGVAFFEIPLGTFRGVPTFSILEKNGTTVRKRGKGEQPITDNRWPGGFNPLVQEIKTSR